MHILDLDVGLVFLMALSSDRPPDTAPVDYAHVARDVDALYNAGEKRLGTDEARVLISQQFSVPDMHCSIDGVLRDFHQPKSGTSQGCVCTHARNIQFY